MRSQIMTQRARQLRQNMTTAERRLWQILRNRNFMDLKFRRQEPIDDYIVDFVCYEKHLVIEVDGLQHNEEGEIVRDQIREEYLRRYGFKVIRFWNSEVLENINGVLKKILENVK